MPIVPISTAHILATLNVEREIQQLPWLKSSLFPLMCRRVVYSIRRWLAAQNGGTDYKSVDQVIAKHAFPRFLQL